MLGKLLRTSMGYFEWAPFKLGEIVCESTVVERRKTNSDGILFATHTDEGFMFLKAGPRHEFDTLETIISMTSCLPEIKCIASFPNELVGIEGVASAAEERTNLRRGRLQPWGIGIRRRGNAL